MGVSLTSPGITLGLGNRILGGLGLPGSSTFAVRDLWGNGEQGVWYEPYDPNALHQRHNLLTFTDQFDNAAWTKTGSTVTANAYSDRWDKIVEDTSTGGHFVQSANINASAGFVHSAQVKFKAGERDKLRALMSNSVVWGGVNPSVSVDLVAVTATPANGATNATLTALGNGEFLLTFTATATTDGTSGLRLELRDAAGATSYTGVATNGAFATDAQFERAASPSSYQRVTDWNTEYMATADGQVAMFQDAAGTTPVTAVEQPVGLVLDKRLGLVRGAELNSDVGFDIPSAWGFSGSSPGWAVTGGKAEVTAPAAANRWVIKTGVATQIGKTYEIKADMVVVSGTAGPDMDGANRRVSTGGSKSWIIVASNTVIQFIADTAFVGSIDNLSVRELPGNHATQATAAARPVLSARKNLLTKTEQFDDVAWAKVDTTVTPNTAVAPDGTMTMDLLTEGVIGNATCLQVSSVPVSSSISGSIVLSRGNHDWVRVLVTGNNSVNGVEIFANLATGQLGNIALRGAATNIAGSVDALGGGLYRVTGSCTLTNTDTQAILQSVSAASNGSITRVNNGTRHVWGGDLAYGLDATRYQRVNTATDYDSFGFPHYLKFDGVDDWLGFSLPAALTVGTILRAVSTENTGTVYGPNTVDIGTNVGFGLAEASAVPGVQAVSGNGVAFQTPGVVTTQSVPHVGLAEASGSVIRARVNLGASNSTASVTNFNGSTWRLGRTLSGGGTHKGNDYGDIISDRLLAPVEENATIRYLAGKSGVTL